VPAIHLIIPDSALSEAIAEGIQLAGLGDTRQHTDMNAALKSSDASAIILDDSVADKKALKAFQEMVDHDEKTHIFLLGDAEAGWTDNPAVECFSKPLRLGHLLTRLSFHLNVLPRLRNETLTFGLWRFEPQNRQIVRQDNGAVIRLTEKETALLGYLAQSDTPVGREELLAAIWGHDGRIDTHTLETHIYQLRRKLDPEGKGVDLLINEQGAYRIRIPKA
jgi:DNA-binding response OmpR family regulator